MRIAEQQAEQSAAFDAESMNILEFPNPDDVCFNFEGEGAANILFSIAFPSGLEHPQLDTFHGKLLRVPKASLATRFSCEDHQQFYEEELVPLLGRELLVGQQLINVGKSGICATLNQLLALLDEEPYAREPKWVGGRVANVEFALLVEDMGPDHLKFPLEFKPKWLARSPSAPATSSRCRNCARSASDPKKKQEENAWFCPLDLVNARTNQDAAKRVMKYFGRRIQCPEQRERVLKWLTTTNLFTTLAAAQTSLDQHGALRVSRDDKVTMSKLQTAMTLRDCTCFVIIPMGEGAPVTSKLVDLDKKDGTHKLKYWQDTETALIDGGFYTGEESPRQETRCQLSA